MNIPVLHRLSWWSLVVRGTIAMAFGAVTLLRPELTIASFVLLFGAYAAADGALGLYAASRSSGGRHRVALGIGGLASLVAGFLLILRPDLSAVLLLYVLAAWGIIAGLAALSAAVALWAETSSQWLLVVFGALSFALGVFLVTRPASGLLALVWVIASYAIAAGAVLVVLGFRLRAWRRLPENAV